MGFVIWQSTIEQALSGQIQRHRMMCSFANVDTDEDLDALMLFDISHPQWLPRPQPLNDLTAEGDGQAYQYSRLPWRSFFCFDQSKKYKSRYQSVDEHG